MFSVLVPHLHSHKGEQAYQCRGYILGKVHSRVKMQEAGRTAASLHEKRCKGEQGSGCALLHAMQPETEAQKSTCRNAVHAVTRKHLNPHSLSCTTSLLCRISTVKALRLTLYHFSSASYL